MESVYDLAERLAKRIRGEEGLCSDAEVVEALEIILKALRDRDFTSLNPEWRYQQIAKLLQETAEIFQNAYEIALTQ